MGNPLGNKTGFTLRKVSERANEHRIRKARRSLGFQITGVLTKEVIMKRYRVMVKQMHPDSIVEKDRATQVTIHDLRNAKDFLIKQAKENNE